MSAWRTIAAACALLVTAGCTASEEPENAGSPPPSAAASSTAANTPEPQEPVLTPIPGEVLELDQHGPGYVFTKKGPLRRPADPRACL